MKTKRNAFFCLCLCVCMLLTACGGPSPEDPSVPAESSEAAPLPEDPNAKVVRARLEELLTAVRGAGTFAYLTAERAETVRDSVKQLKFPILTEEDVRHIAEIALLAVTVAEEKATGGVELPACGVLAGINWSSWLSNRSYEDCFTAILTYFFYLFTPPDYVFREYDVSSGLTLPASELWLYLPLAGNYASRSEALALLREYKNGLWLPLSEVSGGEHPLNPFSCRTPFLLRGERGTLPLDLFDAIMQGDVELPEGFFRSYAPVYVQKQLDRLAGVDASYAETYMYYGGAWEYAFMQLTPEAVSGIREAVETLSGPVLTEETANRLARNMLDRIDPNMTLGLPSFDGGESVSIGGDREVLAQYVTAYLIDLFTPSAYRFTDLPGFSGVCYALRTTVWETETPEDALWDFNSGFTRLIWVDDFSGRVGMLLCFVDRDGNIECLEGDVLDATTY